MMQKKFVFCQLSRYVCTQCSIYVFLYSKAVQSVSMIIIDRRRESQFVRSILDMAKMYTPNKDKVMSNTANVGAWTDDLRIPPPADYIRRYMCDNPESI